MILFALSDIHGNLDNLKKIRPHLTDADVILLTGDITHFGKERAIAETLQVFGPHAAKVLAVTGNCDYLEAGGALEREGLSLHRSFKTTMGLTFAGCSGSLPCPGRTPNEFSEEEFALFASELQPAFETGSPVVLVTHQPPFGTAADCIGSGEHVGSKAFRALIDAHQPMLSLCGHIHEARSISTLGATQIVNPGPFMKGWYAAAKVENGVVTEVELRNVVENLGAPNL